MRISIAILAALAGLMSAGEANALDIRFYPGERAYVYQLDGQRGTIDRVP